MTSIGIKAKNSKNLTVENCTFGGFDIDIDLENVDGFVSKNNNFSNKATVQEQLSVLAHEIKDSKLDKTSKERLTRSIINGLSSKVLLEKNKSKIAKSLRYISSKAVDFFVQLAAAVTAGLVIKIRE